MYNDSIETLLLRHYGQDGPTPDSLEQRLIRSIRQDSITQQPEEHFVAPMLAHRMSRRRAMKLVAAGSAGIGIVGAGLGMLETVLFGDNVASATQPALH